MYLDIIVLSGIGVVGLMLAFFVGLGFFIYQDTKKQKSKDS